MSDLPPDKPQEPEQTLCYATPTRVRPAGDVPLVGQMAIGCASWVMVIILTFVGARQFGIGNLLILPSVMLVLLIVLSLWARSRWRWRGALAGVLIGVGLTLLAVGLCFAAFAGI